MQDPDLQLATASEPLTLDEEYAMQRSWRTDHDKLTFIVCLPLSSVKENAQVIEAGVHDSQDRMIGDINLFLFENETDGPSNSPDGHENGPGVQGEDTRNLVGEIELMIARKDLHRQGYGRATLQTFISYVMSHWQQIAEQYTASDQLYNDADHARRLPRLSYLRAKINQTNERSIRLFKSVGFEHAGDGPNYFGEVELILDRVAEGFANLKACEQSTMLHYVHPA